MAVIIKNVDTVSHVYAGQTIAASGQYTVTSSAEQSSFAASDVLLADIANSLAVINDGLADVSGVSAQIKYLEGSTVEVTKVPESLPFSQPTYRTKRNATSAPVSCAINASTNVDFQLTSELYVSGGKIIVENAEFGDYVTASVYDVDSVIPEAYRAALCEAWPVVGDYIIKEFIDTSSGAVASHEVNTYPLNAKLSAGLYLRITYHAINAGSARNVAVNYFLTKKL